MSKISKIKKITSGFLILLLFHIVGLILIFFIGSLIGKNYNLSLIIQVYPIYLFPIWQLIYVVPLCLWLKSKNKTSTMKGVIIGAILTFLVYLGCILFLFTIT